MVFDYRQQYQLYRQYYFRGVQKLSTSPLAKSTLNLILFLVTTIFLSIFALKPTINTILNLSQEIKIKEEFSQKLAKKIQDLEKAKTLMNQNQELLFLLNKAIPQAVEFNRFEREIHYLALQNQTSLLNLNFEKFTLLGESQSSNQDQPIPLAFQAKTKGVYLNLKNLLRDLIRLDRFLVLEEASFNAENNLGGSDLEVSFKGKAFYLPRKLNK